MTAVAIIAAFPESGIDFERRFAGQPLLVHSILQARLCAAITAVSVVTGDAVLARISRAAGAHVIAGPDTGCGDDPDRSRDAVLAWAAGQVLPDDVDDGDRCVFLDPGRPVRTPDMIEHALERLVAREGDSLLSVHESDDARWVEDSDGFGRPMDTGPRSRAPRPSLIENRAVVITRAARLREWGQPIGGRVVLHRIAPACALRLSGDEDWCAGEALYRRLWAGRATARLDAIRLLVLDFDGVMTDNRVVVFEDGREGVLCSRGDGMGMDLFRAAGLPVVVLSKEGNPVVSARCQKLKIPCHQGIGDKLPVLREIVADRGIELHEVAYMGNDINDLECMEAVGLAIAPADAEASVLRIAGLVTTAPGGFGAVREVADLFAAAPTP